MVKAAGDATVLIDFTRIDVEGGGVISLADGHLGRSGSLVEGYGCRISGTPLRPSTT
ncbi:hypothetical protein [Streptomyces sp. XY431]|uniref:hypothetical protein n=1 Tax=Streptomyces sp. XY431 TaxID=1415562 RepID=UPI000A72BD4B|nr:hypothetical protein [Streptomyces sp. XY431]